MIFTNVSDDRTVKLDAKDLEGVIRIFNDLRVKASSFVDEKELAANRNARPLSDADEISFTDTEVVWNYKVNTACNCHPEMHNEEKRFPLKDFEQWLAAHNEEFYIGEA